MVLFTYFKIKFNYLVLLGLKPNNSICPSLIQYEAFYDSCQYSLFHTFLIFQDNKIIIFKDIFKTVCPYNFFQQLNSLLYQYQ